MPIRSLPYSTGYTLKTVIRDTSTGVVRYWNTSGTPGFEAYNAANIASYGITTTEQGTTGVYVWTVPALPASTTGYPYEVTQYKVAGANLATTDLPNVAGLDEIGWTGTELKEPPTAGEIRENVIGTAYADGNYDATSLAGRVEAGGGGPAISVEQSIVGGSQT